MADDRCAAMSEGRQLCSLPAGHTGLHAGPRPRNPSVEPYYLPMDCPVCGRRRMQWDGKVLSCEKCTTSSEWDGFRAERYADRDAYAARTISVRRLNAEMDTLAEPVIVVRRQPDGTLVQLGSWTPARLTQQSYCGDCDGTGWVEGGTALQTTCATCNGTGREPDEGEHRG